MKVSDASRDFSNVPEVRVAYYGKFICKPGPIISTSGERLGDTTSPTHIVKMNSSGKRLIRSTANPARRRKTFKKMNLKLCIQ